ncbi:hypothetical protein BC937DRAFT_94178 [Endogone sp. FLAS-F59071]|nr:hypothetical protein BC937DRAFT_94178 [Endogone sp. FLAS-F59071]|eukprot:RUS14209.1 hypothetical protein BC937DRAFT_94178 [Endogone sp. FLAS-F59071]
MANVEGKGERWKERRKGGRKEGSVPIRRLETSLTASNATSLTASNATSPEAAIKNRLAEFGELWLSVLLSRTRVHSHLRLYLLILNVTVA